MTDVSKEEIEAAARPIAESLYRDYKSAEGAGPGDCELSDASAKVIEMWMQDARPIARAALTAAAQVRGRQCENAVRQITLKIMADRHAKKSMSLPEWEEFIRFVLAGGPAATEPDSGPSVLGIKRGEE